MRKMAALALLALVSSSLPFMLAPVPAVQAQQAFTNSAFVHLWDRTDALVANHVVTDRSWYWGPGPGVAGLEPYAQAASGYRVVQYFDKARMEINHANGDPNSAWFVTTGLLVKDMVSGNVQVGDNQFIPRAPANIVVSGDADDPRAPTYASFSSVTSLANNNRASKQLGAHAAATINRAGAVGVDPSKALDAGARIEAYNDVFGHNIPTALWEFMNQAGVVNVNGVPTIDRPIMNWIFTIGYPISEAYWARVKIGGQPTDVLIQLFERRVLVYIPTYRQPWNVQMANVGIHYYQWLYGTNGGPLSIPGLPTNTPTPSNTPTPPGAPVPPPPTLPPLPPSQVPVPPTFAGQPPPVPNPVVPPSSGGSVKPLQGPAGTIFSISVGGFSPNEQVTARLTGPSGAVTPYTLGAGPDGSGQIVSISVSSAGLQNGVWSLTVVGQQSGHQSVVYFLVGSAAPPPPPPVPYHPAPPPPPNTPVPPPPAATNTPVPPPPAATNTPVPAPQGPLTVSPVQGGAGTTFTFVGTAFGSGEQVLDWFVDPASNFWYPSGGRTLTAMAGGQISAQIVPSTTFYTVVPGTWTFHLHGVTSGKDETVTFVIQ